jgi:Transcriptional regulator
MNVNIGQLTEAPVVDGGSQKADDILSAARREFARLGYRGVTIRGVAQAAQVSTRTLYNHFTDKLGLFTACIDARAAMFPTLELESGSDLMETLRNFVVALVTHLSSKESLEMSQMIFRDGYDFPELSKAAKANHDRFVVKPFVEFLTGMRIDPDTATRLGRLFSNMATSDWQRRILFSEAMPTHREIQEHAELVAGTFLDGAGLREYRRPSS